LQRVMADSFLPIDSSQAAKLSCYLVTDWTIFDLRPLQKQEDY
jgi:hypothetical protein